MGVLGKGRKMGITKMIEREAGVPEAHKKIQENQKNQKKKKIKRTLKMKTKLLSPNQNESPTRPQ